MQRIIADKRMDALPGSTRLLIRLSVTNAGNDTVAVLEAAPPYPLVTTIDLGGP